MNRAVFGLAFLFLIAGCSDGRSAVAGTYQGEYSLAKGAEKLGADWDKYYGQLTTPVSLTLEKDGSFHLAAARADVRGKWEVSGKKITLVPDPTFGQTNETLSAEVADGQRGLKLWLDRADAELGVDLVKVP